MNNNILYGLIIFLLIWLGGLTYLWYRMRTIFDKVFKGVKDPELQALLKDLQVDLRKRETKAKEIEEKLEKINTDGFDHLQKTGLIRYNPFSDTGGNQSFALAILDEKGTGFVLTSLHNRESTRLFAKPVKEWKESGYEFSKEEIQAILEAKKK